NFLFFRYLLAYNFFRKLINKMSNSKTENKPKIDLGLLEEDDEFEEFPAEDWAEEDEDSEDVNVWEG
ncbi:hypothetical protein Anas_09534, partial [Armadillidium nasatum]